MLRQALPALLLFALMQATQPALARGFVPVCTTAGTSWIDPAADDRAPAQDNPAACPHGWCTPRKPRAGRA
ncbi:MAG: hypothetical protein ACK5SX_06170 [Sandaracinobacter sp.]